MIKGGEGGQKRDFFPPHEVRIWGSQMGFGKVSIFLFANEVNLFARENAAF